MSIARFYPVVDSAAWVARVAAAGARLIQLRIKHAPDSLLASEIRASLEHCARHAAQLVVNDHWQLAIAAGARWVHLGQEDLLAADVRAIRAHSMHIGISTHDHDELDRALAVEPDYVALGPIYPTTLKVMRWAPQGLDRIREWKRHLGTRPLIAIGGLTAERVADVLAAGADSAAVVSDIVRHPQPEQRIAAWLAATQQ